MFGRKHNDKLQMAHTLGSGALGLFEGLVTDLETAADLATSHADDLAAEISVLEQEEDDAVTAAVNYNSAARNLRALLPSG